MKGLALVVALMVTLAGAATARTTEVLSNSMNGPKAALGEDGVKIDLEHLLRQASTMHNSKHDIEEDEDDRFITKRGGALRNLSLDNHGSTEWAEEPGTAPNGILSRHKRCGGDDDDDDDGANRSRRTRRRRIKKVKVEGLGKTKRKVKKGGSKKTTTVTVIQNGQVVSKTQTTQKPVVQKTTTTTTTTTTTHHVQPQAPVVSTVQQAAPVVHHQVAPVVHQAAPSVVVQPPTIG